MDRPSTAGEHEEGGLEGILRVMLVAQDRPANAEHRRAVPLDQGGEGHLAHLAAPGREQIQQLPVRPLSDRAYVEERVNVSVYIRTLISRHRRTPQQVVSLPVVWRGRTRVPTFF
jgi:hypothetical protein